MLSSIHQISLSVFQYFYCGCEAEKKRSELALSKSSLSGDVLSRREIMGPDKRPAWDHTKGGPLAFEGWSDDSGTLFVYKKETK